MSDIHEKLQRRIVHVVQAMGMGGIETLVLDLMKQTGGARHECVSLDHDRAFLIGLWPALAAVEGRLHCAEKREGLRPRLVAQLTSLFRTLRPDAVVVHHIGPLLYAGPAARLAGVRHLIYFVHDVWHYENATNRRIVSVLSRLLRPTHVAVSSTLARRVTDLTGAQVRVIPPGIDTDRYVPRNRQELQRQYGLDPAMTWIGTVGRLVEVKSQATLIKATALLDARHGALIVGDGPERQNLEALARTLGLSDRVRFFGQRSDVHELIPAMDVFCLPSLNEGLPRSVLEAQSCGVPVVASDVGSVGDAVDRTSGALILPGDVDGLAAAVRSVLSRPQDPAGLRRLVVERYDIGVVARDIEALVGDRQCPADSTRLAQSAA